MNEYTHKLHAKPTVSKLAIKSNLMNAILQKYISEAFSQNIHETKTLYRSTNQSLLIICTIQNDQNIINYYLIDMQT